MGGGRLGGWSRDYRQCFAAVFNFLLTDEPKLLELFLRQGKERGREILQNKQHWNVLGPREKTLGNILLVTEN